MKPHNTKTPPMALEAEVLYHELLEQLPVGVYRTTLNGQIIECNTSLADLLGYDDIEERRKTSVLDFYVTPADRIKHLEELGSNEKQTGEFELRRRDGEAIWVRDYPRALRDETGAIVYIDGIIVDATSQKETEETLSSSELDYQSVFENVREAIVVFTVDKEIILELNPRACELYGFERSELIGTSLEKLSKDVKLGKTRIRQTVEAKTSQHFETVHFRKDGTEMTLEINATTFEHNGQQAILSINRDVTERARMEQAIRDMAFHDSLTGLANRKMFLDRLALSLAQVRRSERRLSLLFLDLDGFKNVNDSLGHSAGDALLCGVARRLERILREGDTVARLGGDEYTILIPEVPQRDAAKTVAAKIVDELSRPFEISDKKVAISTSVGIAYYPEHGDTADVLMQKADAAMYQAKVSGKNKFIEFSDTQANSSSVETV